MVWSVRKTGATEPTDDSSARSVDSKSLGVMPPRVQPLADRGVGAARAIWQVGRGGGGGLVIGAKWGTNSDPREATQLTESQGVLGPAPVGAVALSLAAPGRPGGENDLPNGSQYDDNSHPQSRLRAVRGASDLALYLWAILGSNQ